MKTNSGTMVSLSKRWRCSSDMPLKTSTIRDTESSFQKAKSHTERWNVCK
jgi:hypothetical protein